MAEATLRKVPLLQHLSDPERNTLVQHLTEKRYVVGEHIIEQGEEGRGFFIIKDGRVRVTRQAEGGQGAAATAGALVVAGAAVVVAGAGPGMVAELGTLQAGDFFGEAALMSAGVRGATVTAETCVVCYYLERLKFVELFGKNKQVQFAKRKGVSAEHASSTSRTTRPTNAVVDKSTAVTDLILRAVRHNVLFFDLHEVHQRAVVAQMYRVVVKEGESVIEQGAIGDNLYVVESGMFHVFVGGTKVAARGPATAFGELALMYDAPRAATCTACVDSVTWVVDRYTFRRIITDTSTAQMQLYASFLKSVTLLAPLAEFEREKIAVALEEMSYHAGEVVVHQDDDGDCMYIVKTGALVVHKADKEKSQERPAVVARCSVGDVFGERALLKNEPRAATVTCVNDSVLLRLDRSAFKLLLGPLEDIISQRIAEDYDATLQDIISQRIAKDYDAILQDEDGAGAVRDVGVELSDVMITDDCARPVIPMARLQVLGTLGKGSFGFVQLVKDRETGTTYALKAVSKAQIVETGQQAHILSEKNVMLQLDSPFLVKLWQTYQDRDRLYFLLEPSLGGELFSVLREQERFPDTTAMFYAASVVVAFEYMHGKNFVYRDLKPENLLLDERGYLKVTDFGFAKDISRGRTFTLCGTPDYLAPEIVAGKGHGKGVDWWCLGVFMFEMLTSTAPFCADSPMKTYKKILAGVVMYPPYVSPAAQDLMQQLLHAKATKRLGVVRGGASLIKQHRWFQDAKFSFHHLVAFKLSAPYIPTIKDETDVSNFDDYPEGEDPVTPYQDDGSAWAADF